MHYVTRRLDRITIVNCMTGANKTIKILKLKNKNGSKHIQKKKKGKNILKVKKIIFNLYLKIHLNLLL